MEWDMKMASWDLVELGRDSEHNIGSVVSGATSSGYLSRQKSGMDCSVDLKLGGFGDFSPSNEWKEQSRVLAAAPLVSPSGSSKRARALSNGSQNVSCLVDGCKSDLSNCREYHRRHKVCEAHSKTPMVLVGGQEQRFCQQCSRFHLLGEFDEVKRSCRKRLDGHNRRRRKPQPEPITSASLLSSLQGPRFSSYPHIYPTATQEPNWTSVVKNEEEAIYRHPSLHFIDRQQHFPSSYSRGYREGKQFPFLQDNDASISSATTLEASVCQPLLSTISFSGNGSGNTKMFSNGLPQVVDSDCALSLLSSPTQTPSINLGHMVPADRIPIAQPLVQTMHHHYGSLARYSRSSSNPSPTGFSLSGIDNGQVGAILVSDAHDTALQCQGFFHVGTEGSSEGHAHALPFSWQ